MWCFGKLVKVIREAYSRKEPARTAETSMLLSSEPTLNVP